MNELKQDFIVRLNDVETKIQYLEDKLISFEPLIKSAIQIINYMQEQQRRSDARNDR